jgi:DNA-binding beta-propeller fold protein YncE
MAGPVLAGICAAALAASASACAVPAPARLARLSPAARAPVSSIDAPGSEFSYPSAVAVDRNQVWVANANDSVTEIDAATGALVRVISARRYQFNAPAGIAAAGNRVWVISSGFNGDGNPRGSVTEIDAATGALVRVISARRYELNAPAGIAATANTVWVANGGIGGGTGGGYSVTEINAATGALVRVIAARRYRLFEPAGIVATGGRVWVASQACVTEIDAATGALVRVISARRYRLAGLAGIAAAGDAVWVASNPDGAGDHTVTEIDAATGALIRARSTAALPEFAFAMTADRYGAWVVANSTGAKGGGWPGGMVALFDARTGALVRTLTQPIVADSNGGGGIAADGGHIWVTGSDFYDGAGWLAEFSARSGALIRQIIAGDHAPATVPRQDGSRWNRATDVADMSL